MHRLECLQLRKMERVMFCVGLVAVLLSLCGVVAVNDSSDYISAIGDPGMTRDGLRVAIESWNQCNEVGEEAPNMGSPRMADCFDVNHFGQFALLLILVSFCLFFIIFILHPTISF